MHAHLIWQPALVLTLPPVGVSHPASPVLSSARRAGRKTPAVSPQDEKRPPFLRWTKNARRFSARHNPLNHARDRNNRITPTTPTNQRQIGAIALALPLLSYVSFQDDYRGMAPWSPGGFYRIARKTYGSMDARGRVSQKSL